MSEISIILPVYNAEKYLVQCLDSLVNQTFKDIEIICLNDGSIDKSPEIIRGYSNKDSRIKLITQENKGAEVARRRAISLCSGKYIMFCDSDDWYEPNMCQKMYDAIKNNDVDIAMCKANLVYEVPEEDRDKNYYSDFDYVGAEEITTELIEKLNPLLWNKIFKREIVDKNRITFPESRDIRVAWDGFFVLEYLLASKKIFFIEDKLYNFRIREGSLVGDIMRGKSKSCYDIWNGFEEFYNILSAKRIADKNINIFLRQYETKTVFYFSNLNSLEDRIEVLILSKAFFNSISRDSDLIKIFKDRYLISRIIDTCNFLEEKFKSKKKDFISFLKTYLQDIDICGSEAEKVLEPIKRG